MKPISKSLLLFLGLLVAGSASGADEHRPAPDYKARLLGTTEVTDLAALRGHAVLVNTWATWCPPCRKEMPDFERIHKQKQAAGLTVIGVNIDEGDADEDVQRFVTALKVSFPVWRDPQNRFGKRFRVLGVPETFLVNREGVVVAHWRGPINPTDPKNLSVIDRALAGPAAGLDGSEPQRTRPTTASSGKDSSL